MDLPPPNRVFGGGFYAWSGGLADARQHPVFSAAVERKRFFSQALERQGGAVLSDAGGGRRSGGQKYPDRAESAAGRAHYEKILHPDGGSGGSDLHRHHRPDQGHLDLRRKQGRAPCDLRRQMCRECYTIATEESTVEVAERTPFEANGACWREWESAAIF